MQAQRLDKGKTLVKLSDHLSNPDSYLKSIEFNFQKSVLTNSIDARVDLQAMRGIAIALLFSIVGFA